VGHDITQAEALLALIEPGALLELCTFAANEFDSTHISMPRFDQP
jgi:hypothetical protein